MTWFKMELNVPIFSPHDWLPVSGAPEMSSPLGSFGGGGGGGEEGLQFSWAVHRLWAMILI